MEKKAKKWAQALGTYKYVLLVVLAGVVLLLWPTGDKGGQTSPVQPAQTAAAEQSDELEELCREMEEILSAIDGVGDLRLMLTLEDDGERKLAGDSSLRYSGPTASPEDYERQSETVVLSRSGSSQEVVVIREVSPSFRGALVVCGGGDVASVRLAVIEAVSALTGLGTDKISVVKSNEVEVSGG